MFERFSKTLVLTVHEAVRQAQESQAGTIDEEHLVLSLFRQPGSAANRLSGREIPQAELQESFARAHRRGGVSDTDIAGLRELGIDISQVVDSIERQFDTDAVTAPDSRKRRGLFGKGHIPFSEAAKLTLAETLREAQQRGDRQIGDAHLLLAILNRGGLAAGVLTEHGLSYDDIQTGLDQP